MSFEDYQRISNLLVVNLRAHERRTDQGMTEPELITDYLEQEHIEDRAELVHLSRLLRQIIQRLIEKDGILIVTNQSEDPQERVLRTNADYDPYN